MSDAFRIGFVAGVTPDKWVRRWRERRSDPIEAFLVADADQTAVLDDGRAAMCLVRSPVDRAGLHLIPLYRETAVAVLPREHLYAELDQLALADLDQEHRWDDLPPRQAVEAVAAGTGVVVLPRSVARMHARRDVVAVPVDDVTESQVGLAWPQDTDDPRVDVFIGIVRGRTERSSRS